MPPRIEITQGYEAGPDLMSNPSEASCEVNLFDLLSQWRRLSREGPQLDP